MDDSTLWERWKTGRDAEAFAEIVSRHAAMVHSASRRVLGSSADAEDVAQECFLELLRTRPTVRSSLGALLHTLAVRRSLDLLKADARRRARERRVAEHREADRLSAIDPQAERVEIEEVLTRVDEAIDELPGALRGPIVLRFLEGRASGEAAASLGIPESTLRLRLEKGIARVRSALKRRGLATTEALLVAALGREALEAAPLKLVAALGKIAVSGGDLAGVSSASTAREIVRPGARILAGAILMKKKIFVIAALLFLFASGATFHALNRRGPPRAARAPQLVAAAPLAQREAAEADAVEVVAGREDTDTTGAAQPLEKTAGRWIDVLCLAGGEPAAGAEVFLVEKLSQSEEEDAASISHGPRTTNDEGLARFDGLPSQERVWRVEVYARVRGRLAGIAGEQIAWADVEAGSKPMAVVTLLATARLQGTVEMPDGLDPALVRIRVTGISVRNASSPLGESLDTAADGPLAHAFETRPGEDGAFSLDDIPTVATVHLEANAPGLSRATASAEPDWEREAVELRLVQEGAIEGTLRFADTRLPAEGVRLVAQPLSGDGLFRTAVDAEGKFRIANLTGGSYSLSLAAHAKIGDWTLRVAGPLRVSAGATTDGGALLLERGGTVSGVVKDASSGAPAPGISIAALGPAESGKRPLGGVVSDAAGRYSIHLPPGESTLYVASNVPEYVYPADQGKRAVTIASGEDLRGADFALEPRLIPERPTELGRARGRVLDPAGRPLARVRVHTFTLHDPARIILGLYNQAVLTDDEGRYEAPVPAGPRVYVEAGGRLHSTAAAEPFTVAKDEEHAVEDLIVRLATGALEGNVLELGGAPIEGAEVRASSKSKPHEGEPSRTDAAGRFRIERLLEDEPLEITVAKEGYTTLRVDSARCGSGDLRLALEPAVEEPHEVVR